MFDTKFSGTKDHYPTGATRDKREGKGRYDLITPHMLRRLAGVYERGANNHGMTFQVPGPRFNQELTSLCTCGKVKKTKLHSVIPVSLTSLETCVAHVTSATLDVSIPTMHEGNGKTARGGQLNTGNTNQNTYEHTSEPRNIEQEKTCSHERGFSRLMGLLSRTRNELLQNKGAPVQYVENLHKEARSTLTTTTVPTNLWDSSVASVTALWDSLEIVLKVLNEHSLTCGVHRIQFHLEGGALIGNLSGDNNWMKGIPFSRLLDSSLRHIHQFQAGHTDEDHLAQAIWNLSCIIHFQEQGMTEELDDLPLTKGNNQSPSI